MRAANIVSRSTNAADLLPTPRILTLTRRDAPEVKVLERAHKLSVQWTTPVKADYLVVTLGATLAAATVGLRDARTVVSWAEGGPIKSVTQEHRLQAVFRVTYALTERYSPSVAAALLRGSNPQLDGRAPLLVLAAEPPADAEAATRDRFLVRYGAVIGADLKVTLESVDTLAVLAGGVCAQSIPSIDQGVAVGGETVLPPLLRLSGNEDDSVLGPFQRALYNIVFSSGRAANHEVRGSSTSRASGR